TETEQFVVAAQTIDHSSLEGGRVELNGLVRVIPQLRAHNVVTLLLQLHGLHVASGRDEYLSIEDGRRGLVIPAATHAASSTASAASRACRSRFPRHLSVRGPHGNEFRFSLGHDQLHTIHVHKYRRGISRARAVPFPLLIAGVEIVSH